MTGEAHPDPLPLALDYARRGYPVFPIHTPGEGGLCTCGKSPCENAGKHPRTEHGFKDATTDREKIREWWTRWPNANIGVVTGSKAKLLVIDIDKGKGGFEAFTALEKSHGKATETLTVRTGGGGLHLWYNYPRRCKIPSGDSVLGPGVDVKAEGGYIVAPPSLHRSGKRYEIQNPEGLDTIIQDPPGWLVDLLTGKKGEKRAPKFEPPERIPEGTRHETFFRWAASLRARAAPMEEAREILLTGNRERGDPPAPEREIIETLEDVYRRYEAGEPVKRKEEAQKTRAWGILGDQLFFTVRERSGRYLFATFKDGAIIFLDSVDMPHGRVFPQTLPLSRDGESVPIVGIPSREDMEDAGAILAGELFTTIQEHLARYIDVSPLDMEMIIHYILLTWFYPKVSTVPYLRLLGDTGKGKSRILDAVADLCFFPIAASGASTSSGIMRFKELWHGTLRIDEADLKDGDTTAELIKYLNLGFERNRYFIKTDKQDPKIQDIFDPFGPKVIGMRQPFTDNATEGRVLSISPEETVRQDLPVLLPGFYQSDVSRLRGTLARFALEHWQEIQGEKMVDLSKEAGLEARIKQLALPLSVVLQVFPDGEDRFREYVKARQRDVIRTRAASWPGQLFNTTVDLARGDADPPDAYTGYKDREGILQAVTAAMLAKALGTTPKDVTKAMNGIGFVIEMPHILINEKRKTVRALVLESEKRWIEALRRYRIPHSEKQLTLQTDEPCPECLKSKHFGTVGTLGTLQETPSSLSNLKTTPIIIENPSGEISVPSVPLFVQEDGCLSPRTVPSVPSVPDASEKVNDVSTEAMTFYKGKMISKSEAAMERIIEAQTEYENAIGPEAKERALARHLKAQQELAEPNSRGYRSKFV